MSDETFELQLVLNQMKEQIPALEPFHAQMTKVLEVFQPEHVAQCQDWFNDLEEQLEELREAQSHLGSPEAMVMAAQLTPRLPAVKQAKDALKAIDSLLKRRPPVLKTAVH